ncbi:MAG TPA: PTS lactose/cellobiose transporter subunit IIA [Erysipelotrichaceae bacterium]|nr:PTS lactose/cellobiose transporter subunit IIA [Erysipelotrichaceae bacterium]
MNEYENAEIAMTLIAYSGEARTHAFQALKSAREKDFDQAKSLMKQAEQSSTKAHQAQTSLLVSEANGESVTLNVLLIHAQDHLMTSMLALELIQEMILLHESKADKKGVEQ